MSGAIMQMVAHTYHANPYYNNVIDIITHPCENICFNQNNSFEITRQCDVIKLIYFKFKYLHFCNIFF